MRGLGRAFRIVDSDNSGGLNRDEFKRALQIWGMDEEALNEVRPANRRRFPPCTRRRRLRAPLTRLLPTAQAEISLLMAHFDEDGDGTISYTEFIWGIRGKMNDRRMNLVKKAYNALDANHDGDLTLGDIMATCAAAPRPFSLVRRTTSAVGFFA
jgi:hypothetical protein